MRICVALKFFTGGCRSGAEGTAGFAGISADTAVDHVLRDGKGGCGEGRDACGYLVEYLLQMALHGLGHDPPQIGFPRRAS